MRHNVTLYVLCLSGYKLTWLVNSPTPLMKHDVNTVFITDISSARDSSLFQNVETDSSLLFKAYRFSSAAAKRPGRVVDHSPPSSGDVKNEWIYTPTPPTGPHGVDREKYYVYLYCCLALSLATRIQFHVCFKAWSQATVTTAFRGLPHFCRQCTD